MRAETVFGVLPSPSRVHCIVPGTELMSKQFLNKFDAEDSKTTVNRKMRQMCPEGKWTLNLQCEPLVCDTVFSDLSAYSALSPSSQENVFLFVCLFASSCLPPQQSLLSFPVKGVSCDKVENFVIEIISEIRLWVLEKMQSTLGKAKLDKPVFQALYALSQLWEFGQII